MRGDRDTQVSTAVLVYVLLLLSLQVFLLSVAVEAFLANEPRLAWSATAISTVLAVGSVLFYRYLPRV
ncbi:MAG: hypothetical protein GEU79_14135 [Acidimicrobiia bacterium]|nr:hypothetical protein [Acidimicrobiia bacterium]